MKKLWMVMCIMTGLALVVGACGTAAVAPAPAAQQPAADVQQPAAAAPAAAPIIAASDTSNTPIVEAVKVSSIPPINPDWAPPARDNELWKGVPVTRIGDTTWQAVYSDKDIAFLISYPKFSLTLDGSGTYLWDPATLKWSQTDIYGYKGEYTGLAWNITDVPLQEEGCNAFCHEYPPGSGIMHHTTGPGGGIVDNWIFFGKHSYSFFKTDEEAGYKAIVPGTPVTGASPDVDVTHYGLNGGNEDAGWLEGQVLAKQNGRVVFLNPDDPKQVRSIIAGDLTFIGYAEDNAIGSNENPHVVDRSQDRDLYCMKCHAEVKLPYDPLAHDATFPDPGEIKYSGNYAVAYGPPKYMETKPTDFIDAMTINEAEIANGEAVLVEKLTPEQISEYWANYTAVNGVIPRLTFKTPTGSMADVTSAMNWKNGRMVLEIHRARVTPETEWDVQFDTVNKDYVFDTAGPFGAGIMRLMP